MQALPGCRGGANVRDARRYVCTSTHADDGGCTRCGVAAFIFPSVQLCRLRIPIGLSRTAKATSELRTPRPEVILDLSLSRASAGSFAGVLAGAG